jgi:CBS domain-containing protein
VKDYMDKEFPIVGIGVSISETAKVISEGKKGYAIVLDNAKPIGIITEWDLVSKVLAVEKDPKLVQLQSVMSSPLITIDPNEDLIKAAEVMQRNGIKTLPVVTSGIIYGVITDENIARQCGDYVNKSVKDILRWSFPIG